MKICLIIIKTRKNLFDKSRLSHSNEYFEVKNKESANFCDVKFSPIGQMISDSVVRRKGVRASAVLTTIIAHLIFRHELIKKDLCGWLVIVLFYQG